LSRTVISLLNLLDLSDLFVQIKPFFVFLQVGVMDRENKKKMEQLFKTIEELEGNPRGII
tara:strand:- start:84 stop:263 length:180 start_codon:yes stop_codon:yes gene_type:complete